MAAGEAELIALGEALLAGRKASPSASEEGLVKVAAALSSKGTDASLPLLDEMAALEPTVLVERDGCRHPVLVPLHPFHIEAARAAWSIRRAGSQSDYTSRLGTDAAGIAGELAALDLHDPRLAGLADAIAASPADAASLLLNRLNGQTEPAWSDAQGVAAAACLYRLGRAPEPAEMARFSGPSALHLLEHSSVLPAAERTRLLEAARLHPDVSSLAVLMDSGSADSLPADVYLSANGESAALMLSRDRSPERTALLGDLLHREGLELAVRRRAVLALLLQDTPDARAALRDAVADQTLPPDLREEIERAIP